MSFVFPGIKLTLNSQALQLDSELPLKTLSSAVVGGGFSEAYHLINLHVDKDYNNPHPSRDIHNYARKHNIQKPYLGLMTAVYVEDHTTSVVTSGGMKTGVVLTAGLGNASSAGRTPPGEEQPGPGTINTIILVDGNLSPAAMVNALITATEAKTALLLERNCSTREGHPATGTSTDAIVVACTGQGENLPYAGPTTRIGWMISRAVRKALQEAL